MCNTIRHAILLYWLRNTHTEWHIVKKGFSFFSSFCNNDFFITHSKYQSSSSHIIVHIICVHIPAHADHTTLFAVPVCLQFLTDFYLRLAVFIQNMLFLSICGCHVRHTCPRTGHTTALHLLTACESFISFSSVRCSWICCSVCVPRFVSARSPSNRMHSSPPSNVTAFPPSAGFLSNLEKIVSLTASF